MNQDIDRLQDLSVVVDDCLAQLENLGPVDVPDLDTQVDDIRALLEALYDDVSNLINELQEIQE